MDTIIHVVIPVGGQYVVFALELLWLVAPIACVVKGYGFLKTNLISLPIIFAYVILGYYLLDVHPRIQLEHMGFDLYGMNDAERMNGVEPALRAKAEGLYDSLFGTASIKAMFAVIFGVPYPSIVWTVLTLVKSIVKSAIKRA